MRLINLSKTLSSSSCSSPLRSSSIQPAEMELLNPATPMAASPLRTSLSFCRHRKNHSFIIFSSKSFSEHTGRARVFLRRRKLNGKSLELPIYPRAMRAFASVGSAEPDVVLHQGNLNGALESPERSENLFDVSVEPTDEANDFDKDLQELFDEVKRMIFNGRNRDAADLLKANLEVAKEVIDAGAKGIEEAATLDIIALGYMALGEFKIVGSLLKMMNGLVQNLKDDEPHMAPILMHMGSMYATLRKFEKSILMYRRAVGIQEKKYGKNSSFLVTPLLGLAKAMGSIRRVTKAIGTYDRAISIIESNRGADSGHLLVPLFSLGNLLLNEGKANDAENAFKRIVTIYCKLYGEKDGRVGLALSSLARAECAKGDVEGAVISYRKALQIVKDSNYLTSDDSVMEKMRIDLAELLHMVGRSDEGRELLEECLLITEQCKGEGHPRSVTHLLNLATSFTRSQNYVEAERLLRTSLEIMNRTVGPEDQSISFPMLHLAIILYNLKRDEEAEELALEVLQIREKAFGKDSFPVGEALDCLVSIRARSGKDDAEVLGMLERILKIQERELGHESEEVIVTLKKVVFYLNRLGRKDEKLKLQKRLNSFREKNKGKVRI